MSIPNHQVPRHVLLLSIGNTRARFARPGEQGVEPSTVVDLANLDAAGAAIVESLGRLDADQPSVLLVASVNRKSSDRIAELVEGHARVVQLGADLPVPLPMALTTPEALGIDRALTALAAWSRSHQACIVIDAGTAITVDFVDGTGVFQGGAIAPGLRAMLHGCHIAAPALPDVPFSKDLLPPPQAPYGKSTVSALMLGVVSAARGLVHELIDRYAEAYNAYPRVIATGGDAPVLFENDPLVELIVPDLVLLGMLDTWQAHALLVDDDDDSAGEDAA